MKKIVLLLAIMASATLSAHAEGYPFLTVQHSDGSQQSFASSGLVITFNDGNMVVSQNGTKTTLALSDFSKMFFSNTSGIQQMENSESKMEDSCVYDLSGRKIVNRTRALLAFVAKRRKKSVNRKLPKGIYIVGGRKVVVK